MRRDLNISQNQQTMENIQQTGTKFRNKQAYELMTQALISNSIYAIAALILDHELADKGNIAVVIYCIESKLLLQIIHQLFFYRAYTNINIKYNYAHIRLLQIFFEGCYVLSINFYEFNQQCGLLLFSNLFPVINLIISLIVKINEGTQYFKESVQQFNLFQVFRNICILLISIFLSLKIEGYFDIQWMYTLWMFWLLFSLSASIAVYYTFVVLSWCIQAMLEQSGPQKYMAITYIWILLFLISCFSILFLIPLTILNYQNQGNYDKAIEVDRIILIVNQILFIYFTLHFRKELISTLQLFLSQNDSVNPQPTLATQQAHIQNQQFNKQDFIESQPSEVQIEIPKVVRRISKTYFGFDDASSDKKSISKIQQESIKFKLHKALSFHDQKPLEQRIDKIKLASMVNFKVNEQEDSDELKGTSILQEKQGEIQQKSISLSSVNSCCVCYDNDSDALFMQCGHGGVCYQCALDMWKKKDECYLCRKKIDRVLQIQLCQNLKDIYQVVGATQFNSKLKKRQNINEQKADQ